MKYTDICEIFCGIFKIIEIFEKKPEKKDFISFHINHINFLCFLRHILIRENFKRASFHAIFYSIHLKQSYVK